MPPTPEAWQEVVELAAREDLKPLLYDRLRATGALALCPPDVAADLRRTHSAATVEHLLLGVELRRIFTALANAPGGPIRSVLLKGAALSATLYPAPGLRPMADVDLLIAADQLHAASRQLRELGFVETHPEIRPDLWQWLLYALPGLSGGQHLSIMVELHWTLLGPQHVHYGPDVTWFWTQTVPFDRAVAFGFGGSSESMGQYLFVLSPTATLLHLCAHLMLHHGPSEARLCWFYDIHLLVTWQHERVDWTELVRRARAFHWADAVRAALEETHIRFGTAIPAGVLAALLRASDPAAAGLIRRRAQPKTRASIALGTISTLNWRARLRFVQAHLLPSPAYLRWRYHPTPAWLWPLYYPFRWFDFLRQGASWFGHFAATRTKVATRGGPRRDA